MNLPMVVFWVSAIIMFLLMEAATINLVTIWFAVGALFSAVAAGLGLNLAIQIVVFVVVSGIVVAITKPLVKKLKKGDALPTNADRILDKEGSVVEEINSISGTGQVKVLGQIWSAKTEDDRELPAGTKVLVRSIEGVKAVVAEKEER